MHNVHNSFFWGGNLFFTPIREILRVCVYGHVHMHGCVFLYIVLLPTGLGSNAAHIFSAAYVRTNMPHNYKSDFTAESTSQS